MRIVYVGSIRMPDKDAAAARVLNIARALKVAGHQIAIISWGGEYREKDKNDDGKYEVDGIEYIITGELDIHEGLRHKIKSFFNRGRESLQLIKRQFADVDVIITYNASNKFTKQIMRYCKSRGIKMVNDITEWYDNNELYFFQRYANWVNMTKTQHKVKNKIVISNYLNSIYCNSHNVVIPAMCDMSEEKWHCGKEYALSKVGNFEGRTLIYAGKPARKDALHHVINAVNRLSEAGKKLRFLILGCEQDSYLRHHGELLRRGSLSENIVFVGRVQQDRVPSFYALADFMVLLREQNRKNNAGFPTKFSESFISGTPVIANLTSDLGKYLKEGKTGFVVEECSEDAIYRTLRDKVLPINHEEIKAIKQNVREISMQLDYHTYVEPLRVFMASLK